MSSRTGRAGADGSAAAASPRVVMVLENCAYPLDARVRMEAESLAQAGFEVEVLAPRTRGEGARESLRGVTVRRLRVREGHGSICGTALEYLTASLTMGAAVLVRIARSNTGTLHVHNPPDLFFPLLWLARLRGWYTVFDHHDDAAGMLRAKLGRPSAAERALGSMRARSARAADLTIATNETQRALLEGDARELVVVRNSPPTWFARHRPQPPNARARLVFLGEIGVQDRVERAVEILAVLVRERGVDAELLVVGDGPRRGAVEQRARDLGVAELVQVTGWVPFERVPQLLASAHIGLDTAPATEVNDGSTMVKILEYLVVGLPVVATALRETKVTGADAVVGVLEDSPTAFVEPICELLASQASWELHAARARTRGEKLQWPEQARVLIGAYERLAASGRPETADGALEAASS